LFAQSPTCPADVETLTSLLLQDLPSYANRVMQRSRRLERAVDQFSYVIVAGRPEFKPLTLGPGVYEPPAPTADVEPPQQVFFTTLERQYQKDKAVEFQNFHWLFLVQTDTGWRLAMMFTRIGSSALGRPPMPPRESSQGVIGRAVSLWLRDCRAGAIQVSPTESDRTLNLRHKMRHFLYTPKNKSSRRTGNMSCRWQVTLCDRQNKLT
ncbi:hypothetical protein, partial [Coleofasciculus sp. LEGE 07092]|uniref:hypothetical protein n=2 Tax=unclassified Coleofasciculus TaxID=2692782 RepID=UPI001882DA71